MSKMTSITTEIRGFKNMYLLRNDEFSVFSSIFEAGKGPSVVRKLTEIVLATHLCTNMYLGYMDSQKIWL